MDVHRGIHHCRVLWTGAQTIDETWQHRLFDPFWRLYGNLDAGAVLMDEVGSARVSIQPGQLLLLPAWSRFRTSCRGRVRHRFVHFDPVGLSSAWVRECLGRPLVVTGQPAWAGLLDLLPIQPASPYRDHLALQGLLCQMMLAALERWTASDGPQPAMESEAVQRARAMVDPAVRWIESRPGAGLGVEALARRCGLGRERFTRAFRLAVGTTPARHVAERRIIAAAQRLLDSDDPIEDIATDLGFASRYHFTRVFSRVMQVSPARYRRQGRI